MVIAPIPVPAQQQDAVQYPDLSRAVSVGSKGGSEVGKMSSELRMLSDQFSGGGGGAKGGSSTTLFSAEDLKDVFGITAGDANPSVSVAITVSNTSEIAELQKMGLTVYMVKDKVAYGSVKVADLADIASETSVLSIDSTKSPKVPERPKGEDPSLIPDFNAKGAKSTAAPLLSEFPKGTLNGKGVIVGVIDTGIDYRHPDFIRADGTSRILAIWDLYDNSFATSAGKVGTTTPMLAGGTTRLPGTIYTNAQINAALKNTGTVNTTDNYGHGTAVAGTAAGNGRASNGVNVGVAPEADLIIVKAADCGGFTNQWVYGAEWMTNIAKAMKRPLVVNGSFGGQYSAHDGKEAEEQLLNKLTGKGIPGTIFTISAGNEGYSSFHATGKFGPKSAGVMNIQTSPISVNITSERTKGVGTYLHGYFDSRDDWGIAIIPSATANLRDKAGKPMKFWLVKSGVEIKYILPQGVVPPDDFPTTIAQVVRYSKLGPTVDKLYIPLPVGSYDLYAFANSATVSSGNVDFYAPNVRAADFGRGVVKGGMVGSPGNANNVITVGAYNFRKNWTNMTGTETMFSFDVGEISDYSSPGGRRRDGVIKPDIAAPATYTISPLSGAAGPTSTVCDGNNMGNGSQKFISPDGKYIAWEGTSASSPYAAGVIALLLQKNPTLDAEQVRSIITKTAKSGGVIGGVPNAAWGYGMLDPAAAIRATPAPGAAPVK